MKRTIFVTGSADGLGRLNARTLLDQGHRVVVHARNAERLESVRELLDRGAIGLAADLADLAQTRRLASEVNAIGRMDAVIHNAAVYTGRLIAPVNAVAPYVLTALIEKPGRLIYVTSDLHLQGRPELEHVDWSGQRETISYGDSKLMITALTAIMARRWTDVPSNAVHPGWVPTKMGGPGAPDDLRLGHLTQEWLATGDDPGAHSTGGYWFHQERQTPHPLMHDQGYQERLLAALARATGVTL